MVEITASFVRENLPTCSTISPCNEKERLMKWKMWKTLNSGSGILRILVGLPLQTTNGTFSDNNSYNRGDRGPPGEQVEKALFFTPANTTMFNATFAVSGIG